MSGKVLFIGNYTDDDTYQLITQKGIRELSQAARIFQQRLINSLSEQCYKLRALSILPTDKNTLLSKTINSTKTSVEVIPVVNGSIKSFFSAMQTVSTIVKDECYEDFTVLMYAVNPIALMPLLIMRKKWNFDIVSICPELPQFRRYKKSIRNKAKRLLLGYFNQRFDKYIIFAKSMKEYLPANKPYMILEGFAPDIIQKPLARKKNIALYAGGLAEDNGISVMIDAARISKLLDELWICGSGACLEYVKENVDTKIKYLGSIPNDDVIKYELKAKALLNIRNPQNELVKYSFPSKVLEYMAAGGIVISTTLPGIPTEYNKYIYLLKDYSAVDLATAMDKVFEMNDEEYLERTRNAMLFVESKTSKKRAQEIVNFLR